MELDDFINVVNENISNPERFDIYKNAILCLCKNRNILGKKIMNDIHCNGFHYSEPYNYHAFNLYRCAQFSIRLVFWQPLKSELEKNTFIYNVKHNHDFEIFIAGYSGDGYETTIYRADPSIKTITKGERPKIISNEKIKLQQGGFIHLEPFNDIHEQHPPHTLSSSLSLLIHKKDGVHAEAWCFSDDFSALHSEVGSEELELVNSMSKTFDSEILKGLCQS